MCVTQAHDTKKGSTAWWNRTVKLFDSDTAGVLRLRCLPQLVLTKFGHAWEGDGVNIEEHLKNRFLAKLALSMVLGPPVPAFSNGCSDAGESPGRATVGGLGVVVCLRR